MKKKKMADGGIVFAKAFKKGIRPDTPKKLTKKKTRHASRDKKEN